MPGAWRQRTHKGHLAGPEPGSRPPVGQRAGSVMHYCKYKTMLGHVDGNRLKPDHRHRGAGRRLPRRPDGQIVRAVFFRAYSS